MKIQIIIRYLKSGQEVLPGVRASAWAAKAAVPRTRPGWDGLSDTPIGILLSSVLQKRGHFWQLNKNFNSRSTLWNGHWLTQKTFPAVRQWLLTTLVLNVWSQSQKTGATNTLPPLRNAYLILELRGDGTPPLWQTRPWCKWKFQRGRNKTEFHLSLTELKLLCVIF